MKAYSKGKNVFQRSIAQCVAKNLSLDKNKALRTNRNYGETQTIGRYTILRFLGAGGSGVVYEARRDDGLHVALKTLAKEMVGNDKARARLKREARSAAGL